MSTVNLSRVPSFYHKYIALVEEKDLGTALESCQAEILGLLESIPGDQWNYSYAEGKWTIKEVVQHMIDAERIFCYRALRFARNDSTELPGFDENSYAQVANTDNRTKADLLEEFSIVQHSSRLLFASFTEDDLERSGIANGNSIYVRAIGYIIAGHSLHHKKIFEERYLIKKPSR